MRDKLIYLVVAAIGVGLSLTSLFYYRRVIHRQSLERLELCYKHSSESGIPATVCSQIALAADAVPLIFDMSMVPFGILGLTLIILLLLRILKLEKTIRSLSELNDA